MKQQFIALLFRLLLTSSVACSQGNWTLSSSGLPSFPIISIAEKENVLYAMDATGGIYVSKDEAENWMALPAYIKDKPFRDKLVQNINNEEQSIDLETVVHQSKVNVRIENEGFAYVATEHGVFKSKILKPSFSQLLDETKDMLYNFPVPANRNTQIPYNLADNGSVWLTIYDQQSGKVLSSHHFQQNAGKYAFAMDQCKLENGSYVLVFKTDAKIFKRCFLVSND